MRKRMNVTSSFLDILFNILLGFFILLLLAIVLVNPVAKNKDIELKAEFIITLEWPNHSKDDVDLIVVSPTGKPTFYGNPNTPGLSLDRDDLGERNDVMILSDGTKIVIEENWEHITVRKNIPGEFIVNVNMFKKIDLEPINVHVKVERLNPYQLVYSDKILLASEHQEETAVRFKIDSSGKILETNTAPISVMRYMEGPQ